MSGQQPYWRNPKWVSMAESETRFYVALIKSMAEAIWQRAVAERLEREAKEQNP